MRWLRFAVGAAEPHLDNGRVCVQWQCSSQTPQRRKERRPRRGRQPRRPFVGDCVATKFTPPKASSAGAQPAFAGCQHDCPLLPYSSGGRLQLRNASGRPAQRCLAVERRDIRSHLPERRRAFRAAGLIRMPSFIFDRDLGEVVLVEEVRLPTLNLRLAERAEGRPVGGYDG